MKNNAAHNPLYRFAFASIFQSAMNLKSLNVLPPEEIVIESHSPRAGIRLCGAKPNLCGARRPMIWLMSDCAGIRLCGAKPNHCGARIPMIWLMSDHPSY